MPSPVLNIITAVKHGWSACVNTLAHCVDWLWSSLPAQLTPDQLEKLARLRVALSDKYDPQDESHQVRLRASSVLKVLHFPGLAAIYAHDHQHFTCGKFDEQPTSPLQMALSQLWAACFPNIPWHPPPDKRWSTVGFQGAPVQVTTGQLLCVHASELASGDIADVLTSAF
jgi:hypothetical protein